MASRIDEADAVCLMDDGTMVMGTDHEVDSFKAIEQVESLAFQLRAVSPAGSGMDGNNHDV